MNPKFQGCYPTMITPFTEDGKVDYKAVKSLVDWYIKNGADGIFAVCQSSEMFFLNNDEKKGIATAVVEAANGRIPIVASGHTSDSFSDQIKELEMIAKTGVDAVVLVSNRLAKENDPDSVLIANANKIFTELPEITFGLYECPYPYLKLVSDDFIKDVSKNNKLSFVKDVSCSLEIEKRRARIAEGTNLSLFNANTSTVLESWKYGYAGYNGVMANYHIDLYKWMYQNYKTNLKLAEELNDFLTLAAVIEARAYPISAKYYQQQYGVPMTIETRSKSKNLLNENGIHEIESLKREEDRWRTRLGLR